MAGIGTKLTNIFEKDTVTTDLIGFGYSSISTVAPMFAEAIERIYQEISVSKLWI